MPVCDKGDKTDVRSLPQDGIMGKLSSTTLLDAEEESHDVRRYG